MEQRLGQDFSHVRVHADAKASDSARAVQAHAYAVGSHIVFGAGRWRDASSNGLLAHELAHVAQQPAAAPGPGPITISDPESPAERQAEAVSRGTADASRIAPLGLSLPRLHRQPLTRLLAPADATRVAPITRPLSFVPGKCGPDITDWFVARINAETRDPAVVAVKKHIDVATKLAPRLGVTAGDLGEAGTTLAIAWQEAKLGDDAPEKTADAKKQIGQGWGAVGRSVTMAARAARGTKYDKATAALLSYHMWQAADKWKTLVTHNTRYDLKRTDLSQPARGGCPRGECQYTKYGTVTICPGSTGFNCYETDVPGNIIYALIGKFIGWTQLTINLGSQYAELLDTERVPKGWDSPDDTAAIAAAFALTAPTGRSQLCGVLAGASGLNRRPRCGDCFVPFLGPEGKE
jgi:hypothetical protein